MEYRLGKRRGAQRSGTEFYVAVAAAAAAVPVASAEGAAAAGGQYIYS